MKRLLQFSILMIITAVAASAFTIPVLAGYSLKYFKNELKKDSSGARNSELAEKVLLRGVSFEYTRKRENKLRKWGANDVLINAIFKSITDERAESRLFNEFEKKHDSEVRDVREEALLKGRQYLNRFESNKRFSSNVAKVKEDLRFLECEFNPSLGC